MPKNRALRGGTVLLLVCATAFVSHAQNAPFGVHDAPVEQRAGRRDPQDWITR